MTQIFDVLSREPYFAAKINRIQSDRLNFLRKTIETGQKSGEIMTDVDSEALADVITGTCTTICLRWRMNNCGFALRAATLSALRMILKAFGPSEA